MQGCLKENLSWAGVFTWTIVPDQDVSGQFQQLCWLIATCLVAVTLLLESEHPLYT